MTAPAPASGASSVPARGPWFVAALLLLVFAQVAIMAAKAPSAVNPDEELHFVTAQYYHNHWLPPPAADPEVVRYLDPCYGTSYLLASPPQILYPLAAKAALLAGGEPHFRRGLRLFNLGLLCALVGAGSILARRNRWPAFFLLLTPSSGILSVTSMATLSHFFSPFLSRSRSACHIPVSAPTLKPPRQTPA